MILVDTNVILDLIHPDQRVNEKAREQAVRLRGQQLLLTWPVAQEVMNFVKAPRFIDRLHLLLDALGVKWVEATTPDLWDKAVAWMRRYAEHNPDFADAYLCVLSGTNKRYKVWSNDAEFRTKWRRPDGSAVPIAVRG
jgi:predicted nucleic acid-binding protein